MPKSIFRKLIYLLIAIYSFSSVAIAQLKKLTLEDIWTKNTFQIRFFDGFQWMKLGNTYSKLIETKSGYEINQYHIVTGKKLKTIVKSLQLISENGSQPLDIDDYSFSSDESKLLIKTNTTSIYRYSQLAVYYMFDIGTQKLIPISNYEKIGNATFSPDSKKIAFTKANNLYYTKLLSLEEVAITATGEKNKIIHGHSDWVYEEELELIRAYEWSRDSRKIAFLTFDESEVKQYNIQKWGDLYPKDYTFKYPKAGEKNAEVSVSVYDLEERNTKLVLDGKGKDQYIPHIYWTQDVDILSIRLLNRNQDSLSIFHFNVNSFVGKVFKTFSSKDYVEVDDNLKYLKSDNSLITTNENDGFRHIYRYGIDGKLVIQITKGEWEVTEIVGIDELNKLIFYTSNETSSLENQLYVIDYEGNNKKKLTTISGTHHIDLNENCSYYVDYFSNINIIETALFKIDGRKIKDLETNKEFQSKWAMYDKAKFEFGIYSTSITSLNFWTMKPSNFDSTKKYPVFMFLYGGPGSQQVLNSWNGKNRLWFEMLTQKGYIVACVDNRGTGGKGTAFRNCTTRQLGKLETEDQINFARYLGSKSYVDSARIGVFGWSYGGYMSSLCVLLGAEVFKMAIAVAPVTSWRFYDTIYTERFLKNPSDNAKGYDAYSPLKNAEKLKGKYLLVHGTGDDNVHFQNAMEMQNELIKAGKQFDSFYYPNKNHGISGGHSRLHLYQLMTNFIEENL